RPPSGVQYNRSMDLNGKGILIAGATGGLGSESVMALASHSCSLMLVHRYDDDRFELLRTRLKEASARFSFYRSDFTKADEINDAIQIFFEQEKEPYALVNLIGDPARVDWQKAQIAHMQDSFLKNASAPLHSAKEFGLRLRAANRSGAIILFSSMQGIYPFENSLYYGTAKSALIHGAKILAKEFGGAPFVRVNVIAPGVNQAGMAAESIQKGKYDAFVKQNIIPRYGKAEDVGRMVLSLLDPELYMTGQTLLYDGGLTLRRDLLR
ncbi:MAG TPA: SDR family oxidoreductase, partial [Acidobacteriota bacterium]|nr:SDR family oxidoreductase [Acidobacteriota bacterium]